MKLALLSIFFFILYSFSFSQPFLDNQTYTYSQLIETYQSIADQSQQANLIEIGKSDVGKPIHLLILSKDGISKPEDYNPELYNLVFINNGIHPGEACGIDASVQLARNLINPKHALNQVLNNSVILIIPVYNVGGMLNRNSHSRANQNGPEAYGFRGNAKNLDLNRDFIKCDSKNAKTFNQAFTTWDPDFFIDTHTTNGSDHPYTLTLIPSQADKMNPLLASYLKVKMLPKLFENMDERNMEMIPYVYSMYTSPDQGIKDFLETPRYSSGYANLFSCFSFITEAHVFKPYADRVLHTQAFLEELIVFGSENQQIISDIRRAARMQESAQDTFALNWNLDSSKYEELPFKGYAYETRKSSITGQNIGFYNQSKAYQKNIKQYTRYKAIAFAKKPKYFLIPQAYDYIIDRLLWNKIEMTQLKSDSLIAVSAYYINQFDSPENPYEGHYLHRNVRLRTENQKIQAYAGDFLISSDQKNVRYLMEVLEPEGVDSYFAWNFMDASMQQKEWFSSYAFEPKAKEILARDSTLNREFQERKLADESFAKNTFAQLYFIYKRSPYYEKSAFRYPIYKLW